MQGNWLDVYHFVLHHQKELLREAEDMRKVNALRKKDPESTKQAPSVASVPAHLKAVHAE